MASKKEPKARAKQARAGKDDPCEARGAGKASKKKAPKKLKAVKAPKQTAAKSAKKTTAKGDGKSGSKRNSAKHHKIRVPVVARKTDADGTAGAELDPFEVAKQRMKGSVPAIVDAMVEKAKQGSCSHAKTLLEMTGAKHMFDGEGPDQESGSPWAKLVLERLDEAEGRESAKLQEAALATAAEQ